uniref:Uncharacterized protein n=1 Tax=Amorphochlora amoebiformis TaxID=1561963 RepID=A0A7S0H0F9_9EUKA|mmetsp:Transcript_24382/g.38397  ORF Transcript_24382/g.38397 Transcript_24382/m.38397 type:complete len:122 (+) Transcript_24382:114-479(+)
MNCDFRVQCGRCELQSDRESCRAVWVAFGLLFGASGVLLLGYNYFVRRQPMLKAGLNVWAGALLVRTLNGVILASHIDKHVHPVVLEFLWHLAFVIVVWALTYFISQRIENNYVGFVTDNG